MKIVKATSRFALSSLILAFGLFSDRALAQAEVLITPETLNISGRYGSSESRSLLLQADEAITQLEIITLDLQRTDGHRVLPTDAISTDLSATQLQAGEALKVPLTIDLAKATSNGQFQGSLLVRYAGGQQLIPITVNVQARPWLPALLLLAGVLVGTTLSDYRSQGLNRDELTLALGQLRTQVRTDQYLPPDQAIPAPFAHRIQVHLVDVETSLVNRDWATAKTGLKAAQDVWYSWQRERDTWLAEMAYYQALQTEAEDMGGRIYYAKAIQSNLKDLYRQIPDFKQPIEFQQSLDDIRQQIDRFRQGEAKIKLLNQITEQLPDADKKENWHWVIQDLRQRLHALDPKVRESFETWQQEIGTALQDLRKDLQSSAAGPQAAAIARNATLSPTPETMAPPPAAQSFPLPQTARLAQWRIRLFHWSSRSVVIIFLAWAGFSELYINQPTFGTQPLSDYFSLLAWGFGAEVTRESVSKVLQNAGISVSDKKDQNT